MRPRHLLVSLVVALLATAAAPAAARAGSYNVTSCFDDGVNNSWIGIASTGMAAFADCPGRDYLGQSTGLVARAQPNGNGGRVPNGSAAWLVFEAPPGASLSSVKWDASAGQGPCWGYGLHGWNGDDFAIAPRLWGGAGNCNTGASGFPWWYGPVQQNVAGYSRVRMGVRCEGAGGCPTDREIRAWAAMREVTVTVSDLTPPTIIPRSGDLLSAGWHRGHEVVYADYLDNVGIRYIRVLADGNVTSVQDFTDAQWPGWARCDFTQRRPCKDFPGWGTSLDTRTLSDGTHTVRLDAFDAALNGQLHDRVIHVDNHAPGPPTALAVTGGDGWRRSDDFGVTWRNPGGQVAPLARARWRLCRAVALDDCREGSAAGAGIAQLAGLQTRGPGDHVLRVWLEDEAGNADPDRAAGPVHLRFDDVAPESEGFEAQDPADPARVSLTAIDRHSGLAAASVEYRRRGAADWRSLPTTLGLDGRVTARVPDTTLADGTYEFRGVLRDAAGNLGLVTTDRTGRPMALVLPLRLATRVVASVPARAAARRCATVRRRGARTRRVCRTIPAVPARLFPAPLRPAFGVATSVAGRVETAQGRPLAGVVLTVLERVRGSAAFRETGVVRTDSAGRFTHRVAPGPSRALRLAFPGDEVLLPSSADGAVLVPAAATLTVNRRRARNGGSVLFSGRLRGTPLPAGGRTVALQAFFRGQWRTFATPRTDRLGRWRSPYRFGATVGTVRYRFRTLVFREAAYPYETGYSPVVTVVVRG